MQNGITNNVLGPPWWVVQCVKPPPAMLPSRTGASIQTLICFPSSSTANMSVKAMEDGPNAWVLATSWEIQLGFLAGSWLVPGWLLAALSRWKNPLTASLDSTSQHK